MIEESQDFREGQSNMSGERVESPRPAHERLLLVESHAIRCNGCKRWLGRMSQWLNGELGNGFQCEHCGCTSVIMSEGRPYGPRYRAWQSLVDEFAEYERLNMLDGVFGVAESCVIAAT